MNLSIGLLSLLVAVNVVTVLCCLLSSRSKPRASAAGPVPLAAEAPLHDLIEQVEAAAAAHAPQSRAEAELKKSLNRWSRSGNPASPAAGSCRLEHTA